MGQGFDNADFTNEISLTKTLKNMQKENFGIEFLDFKPESEFKEELDTKFSNDLVKKGPFDIKEEGDEEFRNGTSVLESLRDIKKKNFGIEFLDFKPESEFKEE